MNEGREWRSDPPGTNERLTEALKSAIEFHFELLERDASTKDYVHGNFQSIFNLLVTLRDKEGMRIAKGENGYAVTDTTSANFGLGGLPAIIALCEKYNIPVDGHRCAAIRESQRNFYRDQV